MALLAAAAMLAIAVLAATSRRGDQALPVIATLPDFELTEASGRRVGRGELAGGPWVADLIFTSCTSLCPVLTGEMSRLASQTRDVAGLRLVSISVDPQRDTPEVLDAYARRHAVDRERWLFLTGSPAEIRRLVTQGLLLPLADGDRSRGEDAVLHSPRLVLIDAQSRVRGTYDARDAEAMLRLRADLRRVAGESATLG